MEELKNSYITHLYIGCAVGKEKDDMFKDMIMLALDYRCRVTGEHNGKFYCVNSEPILDLVYPVVAE